MNVTQTFKKLTSEVRYAEERLSEKLVHSNQTTNKLPLLLNVITEIGSTYTSLSIFFITAILSGVESIIFMVPAYFFQLALVEIIKLKVNRNRPKTTYRKERVFKLKTASGSFPSGHTSNIFTLAVLFSSYYQPILCVRIMLLLIAVLIGISRLYLGRHYIVDIIAGMFIGLIATTIFINSPIPSIINTIYQNAIH